MEFKGDKTKVGLYLSGQQVEIPGANIFIEQPTINQIVKFGEDDFLIGINLLVKNNLLKKLKEGNSELGMYPDFQLLMIVLREEKSVKVLVKKIFELIFPNYIIEIQDFAINFLMQEKEDEKPFLVGQIHPYNFDEFKTILSDLFAMHGLDEELEREFNPADDAAAAIAAKLQKGRDKRAQQQGPQSIYGIYCSVLSIGLGMDIKIFYNYTPFQLYDAYNRYMSKQQSDFYTRVSTMPFMDVSKMDRPKEWIRNLY